LFNLPKVQHGVATDIQWLEQEDVSSNLPTKFKIGRYHSWVIDRNSIHNTPLQITAEDEQGFVIGVKHRNFNARGLQFHPESILTEFGREMLENWLKT